MKRLASRLTWWHKAPQKHLAVQRRRRERPTMDHIGIDVHKRESQIYILVEDGEIIERRIRTEAERFAAVLGDRPRARILIEASTDSEWVARGLEALGHEVIVADPNFAPMYDGPSHVRWLLIQVALSILRRRPPAAHALWTWALRI